MEIDYFMFIELYLKRVISQKTFEETIELNKDKIPKECLELLLKIKEESK